MNQPERLLRTMFSSAVEATLPSRCVAPNLPERPKGRTIVVGAGKASAAMAEALESAWDGPLEGLVLTRYGHGAPCKRIRIVEASHPVPDEAGLQATHELMGLIRGLTADDLVIALISGGGSALLVAPAFGVSLPEKQGITRALLKSGANINEMNTVRKHLSEVKGGRLAALAAPARLVTLTISDVPGDDPSTIGSGPTVPDGTTRADALEILARYDVAVPPRAMDYLNAPESETPKPGDAAFARSETRVIASARTALEAAAEIGRASGYRTLILGDGLEGEAREVAKVHAGMARYAAEVGEPTAPPAILLSGGETTVTVRGGGRGGRNTEFALALALALAAHPRIHAIACDTDGIDGTEDAAGALVGPQTLARIFASGLNPARLLDDNDAYTALEAAGGLIRTGPTLTNVNDFRAFLITPGEGA